MKDFMLLFRGGDPKGQPSPEEMQQQMQAWGKWIEGYSASFSEHPIRRDVCLEAMRLCKLLTDRPPGAHPAAFALLALMCFHAARFEGKLRTCR